MISEKKANNEQKCLSFTQPENIIENLYVDSVSSYLTEVIFIWSSCQHSFYHQMEKEVCVWFILLSTKIDQFKIHTDEWNSNCSVIFNFYKVK